MEFGSLMPKKPRKSMDFGSLMPKKRKQTLREKIFLKNDARLLEDKLKNGVESVKVFRAEELEKATMNYAEHMIVARGSYGLVYKGILPVNHAIAIMKSKISREVEEFINEIVILGKINHRNVVQLLGCCLETEIPLLVFEFPSNYNLHHHIHNNTNSTERLSWDIRLMIAHESAGALAYLHSDATVTIIHRDVTSSNILLDENYTAKIADFGASTSVALGDDNVSTQVYGTIGYIDPEHMTGGQLTDKSDVYGFGVVLAELMTGLKAFDFARSEEYVILATYFLKAEKENWLPQIVDRQILEEATDEQLKGASQLVCRCLHMKGESRPTMKEVTMELERIRKLNIYTSLGSSRRLH